MSGGGSERTMGYTALICTQTIRCLSGKCHFYADTFPILKTLMFMSQKGEKITFMRQGKAKNDHYESKYLNQLPNCGTDILPISI